MTRGRDRGQTILDYSVGVSVFLAAIIFVVAFIPSMFAPFDDSTGGASSTADRAVDRLTLDVLLTTPRSPGELNETCTTNFFDGTVTPDCRYSTAASSPSDLRTVLGLGATTDVNVTVRNAAGIRTLGGTRLAAGETPSSVANPVVAKRSVLLAGEQNRVVVRVW